MTSAYYYYYYFYYYCYCYCFICLILLGQLPLAEGKFSAAKCGKGENCWFHPPDCAINSIQKCHGSVQWSILGDGIQFQMESTLAGLEPDQAHYMALGFSKDMHMGDDTVVECVIDTHGIGKAYVSFNDETNNQQLLQASEVMLNDTSATVEDGHMVCSMKWIFSGRDMVDEADLFKVFDLKSQPWYLLFARGNADKRSLEKQIHSMNDGELFPWIAEEEVDFIGDRYVTIADMKQTDLSRYWRYRFAVIHGIFLLFAWWVLGSSAILLARFFKPVWPRKKLFGTAVWFQLHRDLAVASIIIQVIAVFLIIYQAGRLYECSYECGSDDWSKKMHVITGIAATALALLQPFIAFVRPGPNSKYRIIFNWIHWFIGMSAWTFAAATILLAVPMGKTGLQRVYGHAPTWLMAAYLVVFLLCSICLEILSSTSSERRMEKIGPSSMALGVLNGPTTESPVARSVYGPARLFVFALHFIVAVGITLAITVMLVKILLSHSP